MKKPEKRNKPEVSKTIKEYRKWRNGHVALKASEYSAPILAFGVSIGVNWQEWFPADENPTSAAIGLIMAIATLSISVLAVAKKDSDFMKKIGAIIPIAFAFVSWGVVCILLADVLLQLGKALLFTGVGLIVSAVTDTADANYVSERYLYLKELAEDNGLTNKGEWKQEAKAQATLDGEQAKAKQVRYVPHD